MTTRLAIGITLGLAISASALADVSGTYQMEDTRMVISVRDDNHVRMDMDKNNFLLLTGSKTYSVRKEGKGWVAMDLAEIGKMTGAMGGMPFAGDEEEEEHDLSDGDFRDTGRTETVAGYKGRVYEVTDPDGERSEVVLTNHKDITSLTRGMIRMGQQSAQNMGFADTSELPLEVVNSGYTGMLRQDRNVKLLSVDTSDKGKGYFELPSGTTMQTMPKMPDMKNMMPQDMNMDDMKAKMQEAMEQMKRMQQQ
jgi:hypothetical protein